MTQLRRQRTPNTGAAHLFRRKNRQFSGFFGPIAKTTTRQRVLQACHHTLEQWEGDDGLVFEVLSFLNLSDVMRYKRVNKRYQQLCTKSIAVNFAPKEKFSNHNELRAAVEVYCSYRPASMDRLAKTFGFPIGRWDVSQLQCFCGIFYKQEEFNEDISSWDVSQALSMTMMFAGARAFNQPLNDWNTRNVFRMDHLFHEATAFNQPLNNWNTASVVDMSAMFQGAKAFDQPLNSWNTGSVVGMSYMFNQASSFNQPLASWNVSNVQNMERMFCCAWRFNQKLHGWNTHSVRNMKCMFANAFSFAHWPRGWDTTNVVTKQGMKSLTLPYIVGLYLLFIYFFLRDLFDETYMFEDA